MLAAFSFSKNITVRACFRIVNIPMRDNITPDKQPNLGRPRQEAAPHDRGFSVAGSPQPH
jgi:hypothetical protein